MFSSDDVRIYGVHPTTLDKIWTEIEPLIKNALEHSDGKYHLQDVKAELENKSSQLWVGYDDKGICVCFVTQVLHYPQKRSLLIKFLSGRHYERWIDCIEMLKAFAKSNGCSSLEIYGRRGWERVLKRFNYKKIYSILTCDIE